jgi:hypothetical protein
MNCVMPCFASGTPFGSCGGGRERTGEYRLAGTRYVKKGHLMGWVALLGQAIVERPGQLPS